MPLRLRYPPAPERMPDHAAIAVAAASDVGAVDLNYTVASLADVDRILAGFHSEGVPSTHLGETLFTFGAYIGEVMVRCAGGVWVKLPEEHPLGGWPVIQLGRESYANPIGKAFKRVDLGEPENVEYFYRVMVGARPQP